MVTPEEWVACVRRHPLKYKFKRLDGFYEDVWEAATHDRDWCQRWYDSEMRSYFEATAVGGDMREDFESWRDEFCSRYKINNTDDDSLRQEWAYLHMEGVCPDDTLDPSVEREYLLKDHPPEEVLSHASTQGVAIKDVYFLCPSCGQEPAEACDTLHGFYCGLCGGSASLDDGQDMEDFFAALDIERFPFRHIKSHEEYYAAVVAVGGGRLWESPDEEGPRPDGELWVIDQGQCDQWLVRREGEDHRWVAAHSGLFEKEAE